MIYKGYAVEAPRQVAPTYSEKHEGEMAAGRDATARRLAELHEEVLEQNGTFIFQQLLPEFGYAGSGSDGSQRIAGHVLYLVAAFPEAGPEE